MTKIFALITFVTLALSQETLDKIIAVVGDRIITQQDVENNLKELQLQNQSFDTEAQRPFVMKFLVEDNLLYIKSQLDSVEIDEAFLEERANYQWRQYVQQAGGEAELESIFNTPAHKLKRKMKNKLRERLAIDMLRNQYTGSIRVSRYEIEQFYKSQKDSLSSRPEQVEISRILVYAKPNAEADKNAYEKALDAIVRLNKGENFKELAKELSEGPTGSNGGYLGEIDKTGLVKEYVDGAVSLNIGEYSKIPVKSEFGYHVIKLHKKNDQVIETSHILFQVQATQKDMVALKNNLDNVRTQILDGDLTFEEAVKKYSEDPATKEAKGYLGTFPIDQLPSADVKNKLIFLDEGDITAAFPVYDNRKQAFHIIKLISREDEQNYTIEKNYNEIEQFALRQKKEKEFRKMLIELRKEIPIKEYK
jgi:peptidyl-prolyl cis-trans isomerase SurA